LQIVLSQWRGPDVLHAEFGRIDAVGVGEAGEGPATIGEVERVERTGVDGVGVPNDQRLRILNHAQSGGVEVVGRAKGRWLVVVVVEIAAVKLMLRVDVPIDARHVLLGVVDDGDAVVESAAGIGHL